MKAMLTGQQFRVIRLEQNGQLGLQLQFRDEAGQWAETQGGASNVSVVLGLTEIANILAALGDCMEAKEALVRDMIRKQQLAAFDGVEDFVAAEMERLQKERTEGTDEG